jgi:thioredoxin reductase (NADPH)
VLPPTTYDAIVVGAGPAGLSAALQLARFNRSVVVFEGDGGRSSFAQVNHNYLGFPGGILARDLVALGRKQCAQYSIAFVPERVIATRQEEGCFVAETATGTAAAGRSIVFATGVRDHFPAFPGWDQFVGRSIFWCIVCDGYSTRGKRIITVGNDDHAAVTALQFLQFTSRITMLSNAGECGISAELCGELEAHGVELIADEIAGVLGHDGILRNVRLGSGRMLEADFLFSLQGSTPNAELASSLGARLSRLGYIITTQEQQTNVPGVFAAGDVTRDLAHQVATAVHEGITAATAANYSLYAPWQRHESEEDPQGEPPRDEETGAPPRKRAAVSRAARSRRGT